MEYTYQNWLKGKYNYNHRYDKDGKLRLTKTEQNKINKKQAKIFDDLLKKKTDNKIKEINEFLKVVPDKTLFVKNYIKSIEDLFTISIPNQPTKTYISDFTDNNEREFIVYEGIYSIEKEHYNYFKQFYDTYVIKGYKDYEVVSNPKTTKNNWELSIQLDVYNLFNTLQYLKQLNFGVKPDRLIPIQLSKLYQREKIIEELYQGLKSHYINVSKKEFVTHFGKKFTPIKWEKTEPELKALIDMLVGKFSDNVILKDTIITNTYENKLIEQHFTTNLGKKFRSKQLSDMKRESSYLRILNPEYRETSNLYLLVKELEKFKKTKK